MTDKPNPAREALSRAVNRAIAEGAPVYENKPPKLTIDDIRRSRQAIRTRFVGPTNHRGARVIATADAGRITHDWEYCLGVGNHAEAARKLCDWLNWHGRLVPGGFGSDYVFVFVEESE